jgi:micrococcal nuclease
VYVVLAALLVGACGAGGGPAPSLGAQSAVVERVFDGDTLRLDTGEEVRLLQVDAPELTQGECYAREARRELIALLQTATEVVLETDPGLDERDRFGRLLRYVNVGEVNVNVELAARGAVAPYFYRDERGVHADELLAAAEGAYEAGRGLWGACPATRLEPGRRVEASS